MIAYRIKINGQLIATIGQEDMSILNVGVVASRGNQQREVGDYIRMTMGGVSQDTDEGYPQHFRWKGEMLDILDKVEIEIIETDKADAPVKRYRSDRMIQENPFTEEEIREMRYRDYLDLKQEFGD